MKKLLIIGFISVLCCEISAQNIENHTHRNRIQNEKIAFFTAELELTPEEAQTFWPVYNNYWKEARNAHKTAMIALHTIRNKKDITDSELNRIIDEYTEALSKESELVLKYTAEFKKILPLKKVAKLFTAEEEFRIKLINRFRGKDESAQTQKKDK